MSVASVNRVAVAAVVRHEQTAGQVDAASSSDTAALPSSLPIISSKGVTEPISTSLMRLIFSSITLLRSCGALDITEKSRNIIIADGDARSSAPCRRAPPPSIRRASSR